MSEVTYFILYILQHNKGRHQPFWSDPLNPIFSLSLLFFLAGTLRSLPVQMRLLLVLAAAGTNWNDSITSYQEEKPLEGVKSNITLLAISFVTIATCSIDCPFVSDVLCCAKNFKFN